MNTQSSAATAIASPAYSSLRQLSKGDLYRIHGFRVLDVHGEQVGFSDWVWLDATGKQGECIGVQLRWLRGTARTVPMDGAIIDWANRAIHATYAKEQIKDAPRFPLAEILTTEQEMALYAHYTGDRSPQFAQLAS